MSDEDLDTTGAAAAFMGASLPDRARASVAASVTSSPDFEAQVRKLAADAGVPLSTARAMPEEVKRKATLNTTDFEDLSQRLPSTMSFLAEQDNARIAHDDVANMGLIETTINSFKRGVPALKQNLSATSLRANANILANVDAVESKMSAGQDVLDSEDPFAIRFMTPEQRAEFRAQAVKAAGGQAASIAENQAKKQAIPQPEVVGQVMNAKGWGDALSAFMSDPVKFVASIGPESMVQNAPGMVAGAVVPGGIGVKAVTMGVGSFSTDYGGSILDALSKAGVDISKPEALQAAVKDTKLMQSVAAQAMAHAMVVGSLDAVSGGVAGRMAVPARMVRQPIVREVANTIVQVPIQGTLGALGEAGGQVAAGQKLDPGNILAEFVGEAFSTPGEIASVAAVQVRERIAAAKQAEIHAQALEQLAKTVDASKVRARDADTFKAFVGQIAEQNGDAPTELFIDPTTLSNSLNQSGMTVQELEAVAPVSMGQIRQALDAGTDVRVPVAEFASLADSVTAPLIDHMRTAPDAMTRTEAAEFLKTQADQIKAQVEQALTTHEEQAGHAQAVEQVRQVFKQQLDEAKRFTSSVNDAYASMLANFYGAMAVRAGMTPQQLLQKYRLDVVAQGTGGPRTFNQSGSIPVSSGQVTDRQGAAFNVAISREVFGAEQKTPNAVLVELRDPSTGERRGFVDFTVLDDGTLAAENAKVAPSYQKRGLAEAMYRAVRDAGFDIAPGRVQTADGQGMVASLQSKGLINKERRTLNQGDTPRAQISFADDITASPSVIALLAGADLSSFIHESGHFFLEVQADLAIRIQQQIEAGSGVSAAERGIVDDMNRLLAWFGVKGNENQTPLQEWSGMTLEEKRQYHEQFARGFEAYAMEGKSPSIELQGVFARFRSWLVQVYKQLKALNVELTDDVRGVMDRMLASEGAIQEAEAQRNMGALFKDAKTAGMTLDEYQAYQAIAQQATATAIDELQTRSLKDMKWLDRARDKALKAKQAEVYDIRRGVRRDVTSEVLSQPVYRAWQFLSGRSDAVDVVEPGTLPVGEIDTITQKGKLRTSALKELAPDTWEVLSKRRMTSEDAGMHPEIVAELFGFDSGDALVKALVEAKPPREQIADLTDQRMLEQYGDIASPEAMRQAADEAVHNEARARFITTELKALQDANTVKEKRGKRTIDVMAQAAKRFAADTISRLKVRDIRPAQYAVSEVRNARLAEKAFAAGKTEEAAMHKRNQLVNNYATRAAYQAQDEVRAAVKYFRRFEKRSKTIDPAYSDQIEALLERFDLRATSLKAIDKRKSLLEWVESQREQGIEPSIPPELLNEAARQSYKDMTVEELRGLRDTVEQIEHLGRLKNKLLTSQANRDFEAVRSELVTSIQENAGDRQADTRTPNTVLGEKLLGLRKFWASHIKAATWARIMDGGKDGGPMWEYLVRTANDAGDSETVAREKATRELSAMVAPVLKQGKLGGKGEFFPSVNRSLNHEARLAIALNTGNQSNLQRLLGGEGWSLQQIQPVLDTLTAEDWKFVQGVWDYFESFRPQIAAKERRVYGKEPDWIEATPVVTKHGTFRGGYYPVKYDPRASERAEANFDAEEAKRQMQGAYTSATTRRSFTKSRVDEVVGRPLLYSLDGIYSGVQEVIHDLSWHEWLIDANKILRNQTVATAIRERYGPEVHQQLKTWVEDIAGGEQATRAAGEKALAWVRQGVSVSGLGLNVMSALMQPLGITQSIVRVGPRWVGRGIAKSIGSPAATYREIVSKSDFMRTRALTRMRELNELRNQVRGQTKTRATVDAAAYALMLRAQQLVDVPTWWGAYEKAISEGNDEPRASALADQAVIDAQGSGGVKDQAAIERGGPALKLFTVFYSFMNTALNLGAQTTMTESSRAKIAANYLLLYVIPPVLGFLLKDALTPGDSGDTDDWEKFANKVMKEELGFLLGLMFGLRELQGLWDAVQGKPGGDYSGPAGTRLVGDTLKLTKQVGQGEMDDGLRKSIINVAGELFRLPSAQVNRTITGAKAIKEGKTENPTALLFGYQEKR